MSFVCPKCQASSLAITHSIELPPDGRSDEITLQIVKCGACGFRGTAVYEESRRGSLESESWNHDGYYTEADDIKSLQNLIQQCATPENARCQCAVHQHLSRKNEHGVWQPPVGKQGAFPMIRG